MIQFAWARSRRRLLLVRGQGELECGARLPCIVRCQQSSAMIPDDRAANRKPYPKPIGFGAEEGIKQPIYRLRRNADTVVLHSDHDLMSFILIRTDQQRMRPARDRLHRVNTVYDQIDDHLLELDPISDNQRYVIREF